MNRPKFLDGLVSDEEWTRGMFMIHDVHCARRPAYLLIRHRQLLTESFELTDFGEWRKRRIWLHMLALHPDLVIELANAAAEHRGSLRRCLRFD